MEELCLPGYVLISRLDRRDGRKQAGIALFALPEIAACVTLLEHASDISHERSWHAVHGDLGPVLLCIWYRPPCVGETGSIAAFEAEWERLSDGFLGTLIVGDVNVHHTHWLKFSHSVSVEGSCLFAILQRKRFPTDCKAADA